MWMWPVIWLALASLYQRRSMNIQRYEYDSWLATGRYSTEWLTQSSVETIISENLTSKTKLHLVQIIYVSGC